MAEAVDYFLDCLSYRNRHVSPFIRRYSTLNNVKWIERMIRSFHGLRDQLGDIDLVYCWRLAKPFASLLEFGTETVLVDGSGYAWELGCCLLDVRILRTEHLLWIVQLGHLVLLFLRMLAPERWGTFCNTWHVLWGLQYLNVLHFYGLLLHDLNYWV